MSSNSSVDDQNKIEDKKIKVTTGDLSKIKGKSESSNFTNYYDDFFENFRQNVQSMTNAFEKAWPYSILPSLRSMSAYPFEFFDKWTTDTRLPLCDVVDKGDKYEINLEIPGIDKDKIDINATKNSISISAIQTQKSKEKGKNYIYSERSYKSFHRRIPFFEEILPRDITANVNNGILEIEIPKKTPTKVEDKEFKVDLK